MTDELTDLLRETLRGAAGDAPAPEHDLLDRVERRHRARRRRRTGAAAAAMAVVLCGSGVIATTLGPGSEAPSPTAAAATPGPLTKAVLGDPVPAEELWPDAVRTTSNKLPDGRRFHPITLLNDTTLLVSTEAGFEVTDELLAYDLETRSSTLITKVPVPAESVIYASDFTVGDGHVAWWFQHGEGADAVIEIATAPLAGGGALRKVTVPAGEDEGGVSRLAVGGGRVYWTLDARGGPQDGVYSAPLAGGAATVVPGTAGHEILTWPWTGTPVRNERTERGTGVVEFRSGEGRPATIQYRTLRNLGDGTTRRAVLAKPQASWTCGITWCLGESADVETADDDESTRYVNAESYAQRRDGTGGRVLPGFAGPQMMGDLPAYDRFLPILAAAEGRDSEGPALLDLNTGRIADLGIRPAKDGSLSFQTVEDPGDRLYVATKQDSYVLVDLAKVE
ncbi:hypothetical protein [Thermomonospora umbrina]|uniref:Uncharacterized protein n=1 Tax=Thermomonospora umbrina TaxID=111806 RepID=A0A3D9SJU3_9ACTN|nr:hypothetical protein [Thermomonospora umbrina]REE96186.1 hypothetical protein DFJ69_1613 [Thermomonospora umbrina]